MRSMPGSCSPSARQACWSICRSGCNRMAANEIWRGDFAAAASLIAEAEAIAAATGSGFARYAAVFLAGLRGAEAEAAPLIEAVITDSRAAGQGLGVQWSQWVSAILYNSLGRYEQALAEAQQAAEQAPELFVSMWALAELIEAASRTGQTALAAGRARPAGRGDQHRPEPTGGRGSTRAAGRCSATARTPSAGIARRSAG